MISKDKSAQNKCVENSYYNRSLTVIHFKCFHTTAVSTLMLIKLVYKTSFKQNLLGEKLIRLQCVTLNDHSRLVTK